MRESSEFSNSLWSRQSESTAQDGEFAKQTRGSPSSRTRLGLSIEISTLKPICFLEHSLFGRVITELTSILYPFNGK